MKNLEIDGLGICRFLQKIEVIYNAPSILTIKTILIMKIKFVFILIVSIVMIVGCKKEEEKSEKPFCEFTTPQSNSTAYNGQSISFNVNASSKYSTISKVEFYAVGQLVSTKISPPFTFEWIPYDKLGAITISAIATDADNLSTTSNLTINISLREGDPYQGGKIFKLNADNIHGLIAALSDFATSSSERFEYGYTDVFSNATSLDDGFTNTNLASLNNGTSSATYYAKNYRGGGFSDWYLPALNELDLLKTKKDIVGGFYNGNTSGLAWYWSSSESNTANAFGLNFLVLTGNPVPKYYAGRVRPIRKF